MIAYKGFTAELWSRLGDRKQENCQFVIGETKRVEQSKTARTGFHCCENPFECLTYYRFDGKNRFFRVEASGDIDEDDKNRIACTEITLLKELSPLEFALSGMQYIVEHPLRSDWECDYDRVKVEKNNTQAERKGCIAIARGMDPQVKGVEGSILGLLQEDEFGDIICARLLVCNKDQAGKWLKIGGRGRGVLKICQ